MAGLSLLTAGTVGTIAIIESCKLVAKNAKDALLTKSEKISNELYSDFKQVEKNVNLMGSFVNHQSNITTLADMKALRSKPVLEAQYARIRNIPKELGINTEGCLGSYFYYDQQFAPVYDGAWYVNQNGQFQREINDTPIVAEAGDWYFAPIAQKKGLWAAPYLDNSLNIAMISYSVPVYKNKLFLGVAGMDIALTQLDKFVKAISITKAEKLTDAFMVDKDFNFVAGDKFNVGNNILTANNGLYRFLKEAVGKAPSGYVEYQHKGLDKFIAYATLPNGFVLLMDVPLAQVLTEVNGLAILLGLIVLVGVSASTNVAIQLGHKLSDRIEEVTQAISLYATEMNTSCNLAVQDILLLAQEGEQIQAGSVVQSKGVHTCLEKIDELSATMHHIVRNTQKVLDTVNKG